MRHQTISFIKSAIRLTGYTMLLATHPVAAAVLFASELIGVIEEFGHE